MEQIIINNLNIIGYSFFIVVHIIMIFAIFWKR